MKTMFKLPGSTFIKLNEMKRILPVLAGDWNNPFYSIG